MAGCQSLLLDKPTTTGPINSGHISGAWVLNKSWMGHMGIAYRFSDGRFEYWFMSDMGSDSDTQSYPITGTYSVTDGKVTLVSELKTYEDTWHLFQEDGKLCLIADKDFQRYRNGEKGYGWKLLYPDALFKAKEPFIYQWR